VDGVVRLGGEPVDQLGRRLAVHHLVGPGRDELKVDTGVVEVLTVRDVAELPFGASSAAVTDSFVRPALPRPCVPRWDSRPALYAYRSAGAVTWPWTSMCKADQPFRHVLIRCLEPTFGGDRKE
jgi:hypothetical protein